MRKFYQSEWHNIVFSSFQSISSATLAGAEFYDAFYRSLFEKYPNYDALDTSWRRSKDEIVDWLATTLPDGARVLSVGCGLGYMEQRLWRLHGERIELHVQDYASQALHWLRQVLPAERIHQVGRPIGQFDLIYLSAVDYAMAEDDLVALLVSLRQSLRDGGALLIISASFLEEHLGQRISQSAKDAVKLLLDEVGLRSRGQFWGWMRSRKEYQAVSQQAGLSAVTDGFIETPEQRTYWVKGLR